MDFEKPPEHIFTTARGGVKKAVTIFRRRKALTKIAE